ncbi:LysR family transcriptional regulator [Streptomyces fradiae]|uniref:LysR family transcriptional regulator n=1 Tax=Streptomyces fradiae TaxID=1906 RepID=UPI0035BE6DD0
MQHAPDPDSRVARHICLTPDPGPRPPVPAPDLDLGQVRAFTAVARLRHFGRAAGELGITQQALSRRVARLESRLGVRLLDRGDGRGVRLTAAGERFLGPARQALEAGTAAVAAALAVPGPRVRLDTWGHLYAPLRTLADVLADAPDLGVETGTGRDHAAVARALRRGDVDAGLGRVPVDAADPAGLPARATLSHRAALSHRVVRLEPVDAVISAAHPLAGAARLRPSDLSGSVLRCPAEPGRLDFLTRFADRFGVERRIGGPNLGPAPFLAAVRDDPECFTLLPADAVPDTVPAAPVRAPSLAVRPSPLPASVLLPAARPGAAPTARTDLSAPAAPAPAPAPGTGLRVIPLVDPTPLYAWSLVWCGGPEGTPASRALLDAFRRTGRDRRWLEYRPERDWLPEGGLSSVF